MSGACSRHFAGAFPAAAKLKVSGSPVGDALTLTLQSPWLYLATSMAGGWGKASPGLDRRGESRMLWQLPGPNMMGWNLPHEEYRNLQYLKV